MLTVSPVPSWYFEIVHELLLQHTASLEVIEQDQRFRCTVSDRDQHNCRYT
jgi:hypothetical protein